MNGKKATKMNAIRNVLSSFIHIKKVGMDSNEEK